MKDGKSNIDTTTTKPASEATSTETKSGEVSNDKVTSHVEVTVFDNFYCGRYEKSNFLSEIRESAESHVYSAMIILEDHSWDIYVVADQPLDRASVRFYLLEELDTILGELCDDLKKSQEEDSDEDPDFSPFGDLGCEGFDKFGVTDVQIEQLALRKFRA